MAYLGDLVYGLYPDSPHIGVPITYLVARTQCVQVYVDSVIRDVPKSQLVIIRGRTKIERGGLGQVRNYLFVPTRIVTPVQEYIVVITLPEGTKTFTVYSTSVKRAEAIAIGKSAYSRQWQIGRMRGMIKNKGGTIKTTLTVHNQPLPLSLQTTLDLDNVF